MFSQSHLTAKIKKARILPLVLILAQFYTGAYSQTQISGKIKDTKGPSHSWCQHQCKKQL